MSKKRQQSFSDSLCQLEQQFSDGEQPAESDAQIAEELANLIFEAVRRSRGVVGGTTEGDAVDAETIAKMAGWDSDDPELLTAEKALRRLATGGGADAVALLKRAVSNRQQAVSNEQRRRASQIKFLHGGALRGCRAYQSPHPEASTTTAGERHNLSRQFPASPRYFNSRRFCAHRGSFRWC